MLIINIIQQQWSQFPPKKDANRQFVKTGPILLLHPKTKHSLASKVGIISV